MHDDDGFYLPCLLFASMSRSRSNEQGVLVQHPSTSYVKALELLSKHSSSDFHSTRADEFLKVMAGLNRTFSIVLIEASQTKLPGTVSN